MALRRSQAAARGAWLVSPESLRSFLALARTGADRHRTVHVRRKRLT
ncbi:hypothetical protein [Streptomyces bugieae]|uniref:DUF397 domain-containing protein n=1 Tax=Streptomyces bugieae TaxID=3098223 RepID=A0ABU7NNW9_9ACTN|nr:hypothetical protein [Streptomyces sp. DSM 41528]